MQLQGGFKGEAVWLTPNSVPTPILISRQKWPLKPQYVPSHSAKRAFECGRPLVRLSSFSHAHTQRAKQMLSVVRPVWSVPLFIKAGPGKPLTSPRWNPGLNGIPASCALAFRTQAHEKSRIERDTWHWGDTFWVYGNRLSMSLYGNINSHEYLLTLIRLREPVFAHTDALQRARTCFIHTTRCLFAVVGLWRDQSILRSVYLQLWGVCGREGSFVCTSRRPDGLLREENNEARWISGSRAGRLSLSLSLWMGLKCGKQRHTRALTHSTLEGHAAGHTDTTTVCVSIIRLWMMRGCMVECRRVILKLSVSSVSMTHGLEVNLEVVKEGLSFPPKDIWHVVSS